MDPALVRTDVRTSSVNAGSSLRIDHAHASQPIDDGSNVAEAAALSAGRYAVCCTNDHARPDAAFADEWVNGTSAASTDS